MPRAAKMIEPEYFEVTIDRVVEIRGHFYRPGRHVVDKATLSELGEAFVHKRPVQG